MRKIAYAAAAVSALLLIGCATIQVSEDFDRRPRAEPGRPVV